MKSTSDQAELFLSECAQTARKVKACLDLNSEDSTLDAAQIIVDEVVDSWKTQTLGLEKARSLIYDFVVFLLDNGLFSEAAGIVWGDTLFTADPESVKLIWNEIPTQVETMVIGAGSLGKSYTIAAWILLDWIRDPQMTCVKVISSTQAHAKRNVFANIKNLHRNARIKLPGDQQENSIQDGPDTKQGIHLMTLPQGDEGKGRLRGFHPVPRLIKHPLFGILSRIRIVMDEAEELPGGAWEELDNVLISTDGVEHIKCISATNPKNRTSIFASRIEPVEGWSSVNIEDAIKWKTKRKASAIRLDGSRCENVVQRRLVFPGLLTWDGYSRLLAEGDQSPNYFTMGRGWYPPQGLDLNVIPLDFIERAKGSYIFMGPVTYCTSTDLAFEGGDRVVMTVGRFGKANGWKTFKGVETLFKEPRWGLQIETQIEMEKLHSLEQADAIIRTCKNLKIPPEWNIVDRTGSGTGVHDILTTKFGPVVGLGYGQAATDNRVLEDDSQLASELYDGVVTELFFAMRKFMEFDYVKFGPAVKLDVLAMELTNRRSRLSSKNRSRVESKKEYKARGFKSPDYADSANQLVHLVRLRSGFTAALLPDTKQPERYRAPQTGLVDRLQFMSFKEE